MRFWLIIACCLLASGGLYSKRTNVPSESNKEPADLVATAGPQENAESEEEEEEEESKRLVVYLNFENETKIGRGKIIDKSGYENYGRMSSGGELLKFHDPGFLCNQGARLWDSEITFEGSNFQAKPKRAITVSAWIKLEEITGFHSIFDTIGKSHIHGQYHFEVNHGTIRWFHRNEYTRVVFEAMGHKVLRDKWTHVAGTYDSKTRQAKIYINGEIRNQSIGAGKLSRDWDVRVGISNPSKHRPLKGAIDEFRIYNNALNGDEIQSLVKVCKNIDTSEKGESKDRTPKVSKELLTNENKELATNENKEMTANENKEPKTKTEIEGKESTSKPADKKSNMQKNKKIKANKSKKRNIFLKKDRFNKQKKND